MTGNLLSLPTTAIEFQGAVGLATGLLIGLFHFATLRRSLHFFTGGSLPKALLLQLARLALLGSALYLLAMIGAMALLSGMLGILLARRLVLRWTRSLP